LARSPEKTQQFSDYPSIEWVYGDLSDHDTLESLIADADVVIYCAGSVRGLRRADFDLANADGVANLVQAIHTQQASVRFLLISSLAAREPQLSHYAASKHAGEIQLKTNAGKIQWSIFRPAAVYGPGDRELKPLFELMRFGVLLKLGTSQARFSLLHVSDLVTAIIAWVENASAVSDTIELHDGREKGYSWNDIGLIARTVTNKPLLSLTIPYRALSCLALLVRFVARYGATRPMLSAGKVQELMHTDWVCVSNMDEAIHGWSPKVPFNKGLRLLS
jgi:nucleoside-diphosphate-sugar epimerase